MKTESSVASQASSAKAELAAEGGVRPEGGSVDLAEDGRAARLRWSSSALHSATRQAPSAPRRQSDAPAAHALGPPAPRARAHEVVAHRRVAARGSGPVELDAR